MQQVVDIARALAFRARVVIMDEPTATLTRQETERLFEIIRSLKRRSAAVIYIFHDLEEIFEVASRVTVLRDGKLVGTLPVQHVDRPTLIRMMIGRDLDEQARPVINEGGEEILAVATCVGARRFKGSIWRCARARLSASPDLSGQGVVNCCGRSLAPIAWIAAK